MQALENPMIQPGQKDYLFQTFIAANMLMAKVDKDFGIPDPSALLPVPAGLEIDAEQTHEQILHQKAQQIAQQLMQQRQQGPQAQLPQGQPPEPPPEGAPVQ